MRDECQHGSLRRQCQRCDDAQEIEELKIGNEKLRRLLKEAEGIALRRPHDGSQMDEDLEGLLLGIRECEVKDG